MSLLRGMCCQKIPIDTLDRSPEPDEVVPAHDHLEVRVRPLFLQAGDVGVPAGVGVDDEAVERAVAVVGVRLRHHVRTRRADLVVVAGE